MSFLMATEHNDAFINIMGSGEIIVTSDINRATRFEKRLDAMLFIREMEEKRINLDVFLIKNENKLHCNI